MIMKNLKNNYSNRTKPGTGWFMGVITIIASVAGFLIYKMFDSTDVVIIFFLIFLIMIGSSIRYNQ